VRFDRPLYPQSLDVTNWSCRVTNVAHAGTDIAWTEGLYAHCRMDAGFVHIGPDECNYAPPPFDARGNPDLVEVTAFAAFPIT
jgi:hypothetical protein